MDVSQVNSALRSRAARLVLPHHLHLKIVLPLFGQKWVAVKDGAVLKVILQPLVHRQVRGDDHKMPRQIRPRLVQAVVVAPDDSQAHHLGLAAAGGDLAAVLRPAVFFRRYAQGQVGDGIVAKLEHQFRHVAHAAQFVEIDDGLHGFALRPVVAEGDAVAVLIADEMLGVEPIGE